MRLLPEGLDPVKIAPAGEGYTRHRAGVLCVVWKGSARGWSLSITHEPTGLAVVQADAAGHAIHGTLANERKMVRLMNALVALGTWPADPKAIPAAWVPDVLAAAAAAFPRPPGWRVRRLDGADTWTTAKAAAAAWGRNRDVWAVEEWAAMPDGRADAPDPHYADGLTANTYGGGTLRSVRWRGADWERRLEGDQVTAPSPAPTRLDVLVAALDMAYSGDVQRVPTGEAAEAAAAAALAEGLVEATHVDRDGGRCDPAVALHSWPALLLTRRGYLALARAARAGEPVVRARYSSSEAARTYRARCRDRDPLPWTQGGQERARARVASFLELLAALAAPPTVEIRRGGIRLGTRGYDVLVDLGDVIAFTYMRADGRTVYATGRCRPVVAWAPRGPREVVDVEEHGAPDWARRAAAERLQALTAAP